MKIIGYGICGSGEAGRYMRQTLEEFKRLCDKTIILCNNASQAEIDLIKEFGFEFRLDRREWGKFQWRIKQDFIERDIKQIAEEGDMLVCLDMDEVLDKNLTREWIKSAPLDAYHVFVVDLWNDPEHYKPDSCFWNVRMWRWNGETRFKQKPVHCGLAPEWAYHYHRHAPFILKHYGLMLPEDRDRKIKRYEKYDPHAEHLDRKFYKMLAETSSRPFDEERIHDTIAKEVETYKQTKPRSTPMEKKKERYAYVKNPHGVVVDIPERHVKETLARQGFEMVGWADDAQAEMEELFEDTDVGGNDEIEEGDMLLDGGRGSYQRSTRSLERDFNDMESKDSVIENTSEDQEILEEGEEIKEPEEPKVESIKPKTTPKTKTPVKKKAQPKKKK